MDRTKEPTAPFPPATETNGSSPLEPTVAVVGTEVVKESKVGFGSFGSIADMLVRLHQFGSSHTLAAKEKSVGPPIVPRQSTFETPTWRAFAGDWR